MTGLAAQLGRPATLHDIPDAELDRLREIGFDWIWFLSVWQTGAAGRQVSRSHAEWRREFRDTLPDLRDEDIAGSGFAIAGYTVHAALGGTAALARLRERLRQRGLKLLLDFVPNHMALDHPWVTQHPERFVHGSGADLAQQPQKLSEPALQGFRAGHVSGSWPHPPSVRATLPATKSSSCALRSHRLRDENRGTGETAGAEV